MNLRFGITFVLFALTTFTAFAEERPITTAERQNLGRTLSHLLDTMFVSPDKGKDLASQIRKAFESGKYDGAATASALAEAVNSDLAAANDKHLSIRFTGKNAQDPVLTVDAWKERRAAMRAHGQPMGTAVDPNAKRMVNFGVLRAEVLEGNVGYLKMKEFVPGAEAFAAISSAMAFLANTDAMIVDVRNCPGGSADTVSYLASYFFDAEKRVLMNRYNRPMDRRMDSTTVDVPGKRMPDTDLYVLTGASGSACESFAFTLQQWGRARTVGEKTSGAGNNNMFINLGAGITFSISIGTAIHPKSGKAFEAVGVVPDIAVPADQALEAAHAEALRKLSRAGSTTAQPGDVVADVRAAERAWLDAYEKRDAEAMKKIVADDFVIAHEDGRTQTRADVLSALARMASMGAPPARFTTADVTVHAYGDTAIVTGRVTMDATRRDGTPMKREGRYTDTWIRRNGRWQVVASHQGRLEDPSAEGGRPAR